ncbi:MAG: ATP synthase subunit I [Lachnospiraceae bacterium]|nr:ATP synthase subunit I [Lachnospiraceae bacterium]
MKHVKKLLREMIIGMAVWTGIMLVVLFPVALWFRVSPLAMEFGVLVGGLTAVGLLFHMYRHLDIALDMKPDGASRHTQFAAIQRMLIMAAVMAVSFLFMDVLHPAGVAFGILGMKAAALMYPKLHAFLEKRKA